MSADDLVMRLAEVRARIAVMCKDGRPPLMSIPADRERDDDLFICDTARDAGAELTRLSAALAKKEREIETLRKQCDVAHERLYARDICPVCDNKMSVPTGAAPWPIACDFCGADLRKYAASAKEKNDG
jgi:hypothetical protein